MKKENGGREKSERKVRGMRNWRMREKKKKREMAKAIDVNLYRSDIMHTNVGQDMVDLRKSNFLVIMDKKAQFLCIFAS